MQKLYQSINKILKLAHRLSFVYPSVIVRLSFVTYSAVPARRLSYTLPISNLKGK